MTLPLTPPLDPMLAKLTRSFPEGDLLYEPKWDGFRCLVFRDGDDVHLQSRNGKPLERYFPELLDPIRAQVPEQVVLDGELVVPAGDGIDFDAISNRIHPAASRIAMLAEQTPAHFIAFDLLALADDDLTAAPFAHRRARLQEVTPGWRAPLHLTPATLDPDVARDWFDRFEGAGLDGIIAKPLDGIYEPGKRTLLKVKHERTADVVVAGFRWHKDSTPGDPQVGSLMIGLFDIDGSLRHVGVASSFAARQRRNLAADLAEHRGVQPDTHPWAEVLGTTSSPREGHRWNAGKDMSFEPVTPLVAEVAYEQMQGDRFRHSARFRRWRPDRDPASCTYEQLDVPVPTELAAVLRS
jgi:ATP-dependent DNA ligase